MRTVRDACEVQPNALSIKLSDQIEQLDELITGREGDGGAVLRQDTHSHRHADLISEGIARLAGTSPRPSFTSSRRWAAARPISLWALVSSLDCLNCARATAWACLCASAFRDRRGIAAFNGRNNPNHFFWGEIADQLGKGDQFKAF